MSKNDRHYSHGFYIVYGMIAPHGDVLNETDRWLIPKGPGRVLSVYLDEHLTANVQENQAEFMPTK